MGKGKETMSGLCVKVTMIALATAVLKILIGNHGCNQYSVGVPKGQEGRL